MGVGGAYKVTCTNIVDTAYRVPALQRGRAGWGQVCHVLPGCACGQGVSPYRDTRMSCRCLQLATAIVDKNTKMQTPGHILQPQGHTTARLMLYTCIDMHVPTHVDRAHASTHLNVSSVPLMLFKDTQSHSRQPQLS